MHVENVGDTVLQSNEELIVAQKMPTSIYNLVPEQWAEIAPVLITGNSSSDTRRDENAWQDEEAWNDDTRTKIHRITPAVETAFTTLGRHAGYRGYRYSGGNHGSPMLAAPNSPEPSDKKGVGSSVTPGTVASGAASLAKNEMFGLLLDNHPLPVWIVDVDTKQFLYANVTACKRYGFTEEQFAEMSIFDLYPEEEKLRLALRFESDADLSPSSNGYWRHQTAFGTLFWVETFCHSLTFQGRLLCQITATDVTEQVRGWEERLAHQAALQAVESTAQQEVENVLGMLDYVGDGFFTLDEEWRFLFVNRPGESFLGRTREEILGKVFWEVFPELIDSAFEEHYRKAIYESTPITFEAKIPSLARWFEVRVCPTPDSPSTLKKAALSVILRDIQARKEPLDSPVFSLQQKTSPSGRERYLFKEMLASATQNKLRLCMEQSELPLTMTPWCAPVYLGDSSALAMVRQKVREAGLSCGFSLDRVHDLMSGAAECAINALVYGSSQGPAQVRIAVPPDLSCVQVWVEDQGNGIRLDNVLDHISNETLWQGQGFKTMLASVDRIHMMTDTDGTKIVLEMYR